MTRDEIRKKWQNGEFVGKQSENNIAEGTQLRPTNQRVQEEPKNIWQQVEQKTNELMSNTANTFSKESKNKNVWQDIKGIGKIVGQSVKKIGLSSLSYMENATSNNFETYKKRQKELGEAEYIKQQEEKGLPVASVRNSFRNLAPENYGFAEDYGAEQAGNIDINHREVKKNKDGSISTEKSITIGAEVDGKEKYFVIPTIIDGKQVSDKEAEEHFFKTHEHLGLFADSDKANKYAEDLHNRQNEFYNDNGARIIGASDNPTRDTFYKAMDEAEGKIQEEVGKQSNKVTKKIAELTPSMTQSVVGMAASVINPAVRTNILANFCWWRLCETS